MQSPETRGDDIVCLNAFNPDKGEEVDTCYVDFSNEETLRFQLQNRARYWVEEYGGEGLTFTHEQESILANEIQAGLAAQKALDDGGRVTTGRLTAVESGKRAEQALVETNLRVAFMFARESVGQTHAGVRRRNIARVAAWAVADEKKNSVKSGPKRSKTNHNRGRFMGTYAPLGSMKSIYSELEDRYIMASMGLVKAARKFQPARGANFVTYAAWHIQSTMQRECIESEHNGTRFPAHVADRVNRYFGDYPSVSADHVVPDEIAPLLMVSDFHEYPEEFGTLQEGGLEELNDPWGQDDRAVGLAEVWDDDEDTTQLIASDHEATEQINIVFDTLSEREAGVVALRYGLADCTCHAGEGKVTHTLDEIGRIYGVTRERIRQVESKTMSKLRHMSRRQALDGLLELMADADSAPPMTIWRGDVIKLPEGQATHMPDQEYKQALSGMPPVVDERQHRLNVERKTWAERESWQAVPGEPWDMELHEREKKASDELAQELTEVLANAQTYHFSKSFAYEANTLGPNALLATFNELRGRSVLSASQVSDMWRTFMKDTYPILEEKLTDDFSHDRVGQLFSRIIAENIADNDTPVVLEIPEYASGKIGYMATNLGLGKVIIRGDVGDHAGSFNHGYAVVVIRGDVGDRAGARMRDEAGLRIYGLAGKELGFYAEGNAHIVAGAPYSVGKHEDTVRIDIPGIRQRYIWID